MSTVLTRLDPQEDGLLRRLHCLEQLGAQLAPPLRVLKAELRARDQRRIIREPADHDVISPIWIT
jgi:hypothetical protein